MTALRIDHELCYRRKSPDADHADVVDHGDVVRAVAVEVAGAQEIPLRRIRDADHADIDNCYGSDSFLFSFFMFLCLC